jgi:tocopherol O-methyltransferase
VITPKREQTTAAVAAHYDELDLFYREIWGEHVHHGYWVTGDETVQQAVEALIELLAARLKLTAGQAVCDIGCGYGATARYLAEQFAVSVTGFSVSAAQVAQARLIVPAAGTVAFETRDWLANGQADQKFDRAYAVESSEHMPDKQLFFDEAYRVLRPDGALVVCAWLAADRPKPWQVRHLLEPICREGRLPGMGDEADYRAMGAQAGFEVEGVEDISANVSRTWEICARRLLRMAITKPRYLRFLVDRRETNRVFALTLFRLMLAYRTQAMRYCLLTYRKPHARNMR